MIEVERRESAAAPDAVVALFEALKSRPGVWMGCDVEAQDQYRKESIACAVPALRLCLDGPRLLVTPITLTGMALLPLVRELADFADCDGSLAATMPSGAAVVALLRRFLAQFRPATREFGLYGSFSFDFYRLGQETPLPDDRRRRLVLYVPQRVLVASADGVRWIDFRFGGEDSRAEPADAPIPPVRLDAAVDELAPGEHAKRVARGVTLLRRGELYSLVLSQCFRRPIHVRPSQAFRALRRRNPYPGMFFCNLGGEEILFGASPDQQVLADREWVESSPVCGTVRRGSDPLDDAAQALELLGSPKEAAALALCADSAAEELAAVCVPGSVAVLTRRRLHFFSTIIHTIDHLRGRRRPGMDGFDVLLAHATPATVTGLPKASAISVIEDLEPQWRGWYAGAVARIGSDGSVEAYTILRAARIAGGVAEVRTGGNILVDSDPEKEEEESRLKAQTLFAVLEGAMARPEVRTAGDIAWRVRQLAGADPFRHRLVDALARAGGRLREDGRISVLSDVADEVPEEPLLAIGTGAAWLLRCHGARTERFPVPEFARVVEGRATPGGFLATLSDFEAGWYMHEGIRSGSLPSNWVEAAVSTGGWVLAAQHREQRVCAVLFRPDSVLSSRGGAGTRALRATFEWLDPCDMLAAENTREDR